jgi:branched-chain amino acid transport system ATP-binding protein
MGGAALELQGLTVTHGSVTALHDVSLAAPAGKITVLLGANGAGKSSLFRAVMGLATSRGAVLLDGHDISRNAVEDRVRAGLAWVPEGRRVFPGLTVAENLLVSSRARRQARAQKLAEIFALFPQLAARPGDRAWQLSGGQQQMLAIGRAMMADPRVYLLDEPSLGLAPAIAGTLADALQKLASGGAAVLIGEQNAGFSEPLADQTIRLRNGYLIPGAGNPARDQGQRT